MFRFFRRKSAILHALSELLTENGNVKAAYGAQCVEIAELRRAVADREAMLKQAYARLDAIKLEPRRDSAGRFARKVG